MDAEDWRRAKSALDTALDPQGNGASVAWDNPVRARKVPSFPLAQAFPEGRRDLPGIRGARRSQGHASGRAFRSSACRTQRRRVDRRAQITASRGRVADVPKQHSNNLAERDTKHPLELGIRALAARRGRHGLIDARSLHHARRVRRRPTPMRSRRLSGSSPRSITPTRTRTPRPRSGLPRPTQAYEIVGRRDQARAVRPRRDRRRGQAALSGVRGIRRTAPRRRRVRFRGRGRKPVCAVDSGRSSGTIDPSDLFADLFGSAARVAARRRAKRGR